MSASEISSSSWVFALPWHSRIGAGRVSNIFGFEERNEVMVSTVELVSF